MRMTLPWWRWHPIHHWSWMCRFWTSTIRGRWLISWRRKSFMQLTDSHGRNINYLRLSVTDRCNMRCFYCMPKEGIIKQEHGTILSYEELLLIAETAIGLGIEKIRIAGGEPLVRSGIIDFLERLARLSDLK